MGTVTGSVAGGPWNTTGAWLLGVQPTAADDVVLNATSGTITVTAGSVCRSLDCTGFAATLNGSGDLSIGDGSGGACTLAGTISGTWTTTFKSTSNNGGTGWGVTSGGKTFPGAVTFNGVGGKWVLQDNFTSNANGAGITVTNGAFFGNGKTIAIAVLSSSGSATRTIDLTSCTVTCNQGGLGTVWALVSTGLTWVAPTTLTVTTGSSTTFQGGGLAYNSVSFTNVGNAIVQGANSYTNFTRTGSAAKTDGLSLAATNTVSGTLTLGGNTTSGVNRILVFSSTRGTARTFACSGAAVVINGDVDFMDITITGSPSWTNSASYVGDAGGNTGLTITVAATQTHTSSAGGNYSDVTKWTSRVPLPQDNVVVDVNTTGTLTIDMPRLGANHTFTGFLGTCSWAAAEMYGSLTLGNGMTYSGSTALTLAGRGSHTITSATKTMSTPPTINGPGGTYQLLDTLAVSNSVTVTLGTLDTNGQACSSTGAMSVANAAGAGLTMGATTWTLSGTAAVTYWNIGANATISAASGTIVFSTTSANTRTFAGAGKTYGTLTYTVAGSTGQLTITGANTFSAINFSDATNARTLSMPTATATTISTVNGFGGVVGTAGKLMSVVGDVTSVYTQWTDYLSISSSDALGPGWYAGANSTDGGSNTGWLFRARTPSSPNPSPRPRRALFRSAA